MGYIGILIVKFKILHSFYLIMKKNYFFGIIKITIGILLLASVLFAIVFELLTHYYFNKSEALIFYQTLPKYVMFFMNFSASMGAIITSLIAIYYIKSGILEMKQQEPILLIIRILVNLVPAVLIGYLSFLVFYTLLASHEAEQWGSIQKYAAPVLLPFFMLVFIREFFLDKIYK